MTTYRGGYDASLARYNARRRELQASMLEYSAHMRQLQTHRSLSPGKDMDSNAESGTHGRLLTRHSDPAFITTQLRQGRPFRKRPSSLDEKELQHNANARISARRDTKSERPPVTIPTALPTITNPPNTPDLIQKGNVRVSFVSASDLYDIVDFGTSSKPSRRESSRLANVRDGIKLIENIDLQQRRERHMAWDKQGNGNGKEKENLSSIEGSSMELLTAKKIRPQVQNVGKESSKIQLSPKFNSIPEEQEGGNTISSDNEVISPLNLLLERAAASHVKRHDKVRIRPKRAKRMQLHKSDLVVIPEDGGTFVSSNDDQLWSSQKGQANSVSEMVPGKSSCSNSSLDSKHVSNMHPSRDVSPDAPQLKIGNWSDKGNDVSSDTTFKHKHSHINNDHNRKPILKRTNQNGNESPVDRKQLNNLVITKAVQPSVTASAKKVCNDGSVKGRDKHVSFDTNANKAKGKRKMKRLVFLQDQPEDTYRQEM